MYKLFSGPYSTYSPYYMKIQRKYYYELSCQQIEKMAVKTVALQNVVEIKKGPVDIAGVAVAFFMAGVISETQPTAFQSATTTTTILRPFLQDYPGESVPEGQTILDFAEADMTGWQWHQLNHMQAICTLLQKITMPAPYQSDFYGLDAFLAPNQQRQSTEGQFQSGT